MTHQCGKCGGDLYGVGPSGTHWLHAATGMSACPAPSDRTIAPRVEGNLELEPEADCAPFRTLKASAPVLVNEGFNSSQIPVGSGVLGAPALPAEVQDAIERIRNRVKVGIWPYLEADIETLLAHLRSQPAPMGREALAARFIKESGKTVHASDCATSVAPAEEPGPCDCDEPQPAPQAEEWPTDCYRCEQPIELKDRMAFHPKCLKEYCAGFDPAEQPAPPDEREYLLKLGEEIGGMRLTDVEGNRLSAKELRAKIISHSKAGWQEYDRAHARLQAAPPAPALSVVGFEPPWTLANWVSVQFKPDGHMSAKLIVTDRANEEDEEVVAYVCGPNPDAQEILARQIVNAVNAALRAAAGERQP